MVIPVAIQLLGSGGILGHSVQTRTLGGILHRSLSTSGGRITNRWQLRSVRTGRSLNVGAHLAIDLRLRTVLTTLGGALLFLARTLLVSLALGILLLLLLLPFLTDLLEFCSWVKPLMLVRFLYKKTFFGGGLGRENGGTRRRPIASARLLLGRTRENGSAG